MTQRLRVLDAIRGLSVCGIVLVHYFGRYGPPWLPLDLSHLGTPFFVAEMIGATGFNILLLISGFVIPMTLAASAGTGEFVARRVGRIYPPFLLWLTVTLMAVLVIDPVGPQAIFHVGWIDYWANVTLHPLSFGRTYIDSVYWTLTVEIQFYVLLALCHAMFGHAYRWPFLAVGIIGAGLVRFGWHAVLVFSYIPLLLLGMSAWQWLVERRQRDAAAFGVVGVVLYVMNHGEFVYRVAGAPDWVAHATTAGGAAVMVWLLRHRPNASLGPFAWVGLISYSLYLVHNRLGMLATGQLQVFGVSAGSAIAISITLSVIVAWVSHVFVEKPGQRLVLRAYKRWFPHRTT